MKDKTEPTLLEQTLEMITLAQTKGFDFTLSIHPFMWEHWMPFEDVFCNQACAVMAWWLRDKYYIQITITYMRNCDPKLYKWFAEYYNTAGLVFDTTADCYLPSYEQTWLDAITYALNALPPAAPGNAAAKPL